jgi:DNA-binding transcriptional MerR regulator
VKSTLAAFVQRNRDALQFFAQGAQYEQSRYPIDLSKGSDTQLPHLMGIKHGMQMAEMSAILDAENNDEKQAADDVLMTLALARSLKSEPVLISQLVRAAGVGLAVAALEQVMNRTTLPPESLSELSKAFQNMEDYDARGEGFNRAMTGENVNWLAQLKNRDKLVRDLTTPGATGMPDEQSRQMIQYLKQTVSLKEEQDYLETSFQQLLSARQEAFPGRLKVVADLIRQLVTEATSRGLLLNGWYLDGLDKPVSREAGCLANLRLALTAVALEQFRATHNQYPTALSELVPNYLDATPMDPFDGQPLRYRKQDAGYVLYSIGPDLKDDGGKRMTAKGGDMVFTVVTPPAQ